MTETLDSCQRRILELVQSTQQEGAVANVETVSKEIAALYAKMGDLFLSGKDIDSASKCFETALELDPTPWPESDNWRRTRAFLTEMVARSPRDINLLNQLGELHQKLREYDKALDCFRRVLDIAPDNIPSLYWIPIIQQTTGDLKAAEESFRHTAKVQPLYKIPATKTPPDFSVLTIFAPLFGNTPINDLMEKASYEINIFSLLSHAEYDLALLKRSGKIVVNAVSDADASNAILPEIVQLVDKLDMPVINHPSKIQRTTREGIAKLLQGIPDCRLARVVRHVAGEETTVEGLQKKISFPMPLLARPAGTHGGKKFEKIESLPALASFIRQDPATDHYIMEYIDYQSPDGHFRKYRFFFVDDKILPYHLAIGDHWKVHHATTDMNKNEAMQAEEKAFLENPQAVFTPKHYQALRAIRQAVGLDYFGIDCGLDHAGNLIVFEANASMLVHWHNETFPYKTPFVENIKRAFDEMLKKRAGLANAR